jgi:hypothetical protein
MGAPCRGAHYAGPGERHRVSWIGGDGVKERSKASTLRRSAGVVVTVTVKTKEGVLWVVTGLAVAYVRHGIETQWASWESAGQFFGYWFIHSAALALFVSIAGATIGRFYEFFLGYKRESAQFDDVIYMILMTVLIGSVCVFIVAHWSPSDE